MKKWLRILCSCSILVALIVVPAMLVEYIVMGTLTATAATPVVIYRITMPLAIYAAVMYWRDKE